MRYKPLFSMLFLILGLLFSMPVYANTITVQTFTSDSNFNHVENFRNIIVTEFNGSIEGSTNGTSVANIKAASIYEINMANDANPRLRDSELFGITVDTSSSSATYVFSGLTPATSSNLTSNISTGTVYINGYRVNKAATSQTYTASRDTYVDLSQGGTFTLTPVSNGAGAPAVAANSARLARVVTSATAITSVVDLAKRTVPGLVVATNFRDGLFISRDSATTITVLPGNAEINGTSLTKTAVTTLTLGTAGDWAGGTSLRAADTFGFVGIDTSGNLKMHTTAPNFDNYARTTSAGKLRYVSWSSTTYRVLGWFYMDGSGSGTVEVASNIKEGNLPNRILSQDPTTAGVVTAFSTTSTTDVDLMKVRFYASGNPVIIRCNTSGSNGSSVQSSFLNLSQDLSTTSLYAERRGRDASGTDGVPLSTEYMYTPPQAARTYRAVYRVSGSTGTVNGRTLIVEES